MSDQLSAPNTKVNTKLSAEDAYEKAMEHLKADELAVQYRYRSSNLRTAAEFFELAGDYQDASQHAALCREMAEKAEEEGKADVCRAVREREKIAKKDDEWASMQKDLEKLGDYPAAKEELKKVLQVRRKKARKSKVIRSIVLAVIILAAAGIPVGIHNGFFKYMMGWIYSKADMYSMAEAAYRKAHGFADSGEKLKAERLRHLDAAEVGDDVPYGDYTWKILSREDGKIVMIASALKEDSDFYGQPFNKDDADVTWEDSTLRSWLNGEIYEDGFADYEKEHMLLQTAEESGNQEYGTKYESAGGDYLTILSAEETDGYKDEIGSLSGTWWLRTPGNAEDTAAVMSADHTVLYYGYPVDYTELYVRPVITIEDGWMEEEE